MVSARSSSGVLHPLHNYACYKVFVTSLVFCCFLSISLHFMDVPWVLDLQLGGVNSGDLVLRLERVGVRPQLKRVLKTLALCPTREVYVISVASLSAFFH